MCVAGGHAYHHLSAASLDTEGGLRMLAKVRDMPMGGNSMKMNIDKK